MEIKVTDFSGEGMNRVYENGGNLDIHAVQGL